MGTLGGRSWSYPDACGRYSQGYSLAGGISVTSGYQSTVAVLTDHRCTGVRKRRTKLQVLYSSVADHNKKLYCKHTASRG